MDAMSATTGGTMDRLYYVEKHDETHQTSDRFEAKRIAAEWIRRGYDVDVAVIAVGEDTVEQVAA